MLIRAPKVCHACCSQPSAISKQIREETMCWANKPYLRTELISRTKSASRRQDTSWHFSVLVQYHHEIRDAAWPSSFRKKLVLKKLDNEIHRRDTRSGLELLDAALGFFAS